MQRSLIGRLEDLEKRSGSVEPMLILRTIVAPGANGPIHIDPVAVQSDSWRLERSPGEAVDAFRARAAEAAPRNRWGVARLVEIPA